MVFWVEDGRPVNQVLGSRLPARPLPVPYPASETPAAAAEAGGTSPVAVWALAGALLVAGVAGGALYLRARSRRA